MKKLILTELDDIQDYLLRSLSPFDEADSGFSPDEESYSVAAQVMHIALTVEWFSQGTFGSGFDVSFEEHDRLAKACTSLEKAKARFVEEIKKIRAIIESKTDDYFLEPYPEDSLVQGPKAVVAYGLADHTAHHRGALTVYLRLLGKKPVMPYMDM